MAYQDDPGDETPDQWPDPPRLLPPAEGRKDDAVIEARKIWDEILASLAPEAARQDAIRQALLEQALRVKL